MDRLEAMRAYVRLVEIGSFSKVGTELRVKQSTVSKWVAALEARLGVQLIERTSRSQRVTEQGRLFYERCKEMLATWEATEAQLQELSPELRGRLRVSLPVVFGRLYVVPHVADFMARHPELEVELVLDDRYVRIVEEGFDVAIRVGVPIDSSLRGRTLARTPRHLVAAPSYLNGAPALRTPKDLRHHECLSHTGLRTDAVWTFRKHGKTAKASVRGRFGTNNSEAALSMARAGHGVALLASWLVDSHIESGELVPLLTDWERTDAPIQALMPPTSYVHPRVSGLLDFLQARLSL